MYILFDSRAHLVRVTNGADVSFVVLEPSTCRGKGHLMHRGFLVDVVNVVSLGGQPPRTNAKGIVEVLQRTMRKQ